MTGYGVSLKASDGTKHEKIMDDVRNKLLLQLTGQEFVDLLREGLGLSMLGYDDPEPLEVKKHLVYGLQGLCDLLGCSISTAARIKKSGVIDAAISQTGKIIVIDADLALDLLNSHKKRSGMRGGYKRK